ncbi:hypothetical protein [Tianweitania sp.]|uniref:hypothetical protein n=1 Tax=Tianweitania sp. TaxID=2021634 RepID=UPI00289E9940|nr:hypothetical protein [Tianweitania sp.]
MSLTAIGAFTLVLGFASLFMPVGLAIGSIAVLSILRTAAALNLTSVGGLSVICANLFLLFYMARAVRRVGPAPVLQSLLPPSPGFWLLLLAIYAVVSALFFPRMMAGITETISIVRDPDGKAALQLRPLENNSMYVSQLIYFLGGVATFMATFALTRLPDGMRQLRRAIYLVLGLHVLLGIVDVLTYQTGTAFLLGFIRTANYALLTDAEKGGLKRITGSFSEASAFACFSLVLFAISVSLWLDRQRPRVTGCFAVAMLVLLLASTSGTAYVGLAVFLLALVLYEFGGPFVGRPIRRPIALFSIAVLGLAFLMLLLLLAPSIADRVQEFFEETVVGKISDASGRERMMWNEVAFQNFLDSYGLGVGIGGARASSFLLVLLSNVGLPGFILFAGFVASLLWMRLDRTLSAEDRRFVTALRCGLVGALIAESIVGAVFDIGLFVYVMAGGIAAASFAPHRAAIRQPFDAPLTIRPAFVGASRSEALA